MWWVAHVILVSVLGPNPSFLFWWTFLQLWGLLGQGLRLGPGLDNRYPLPNKRITTEGKIEDVNISTCLYELARYVNIYMYILKSATYLHVTNKKYNASPLKNELDKKIVAAYLI